jgi:hypothetical protein
MELLMFDAGSWQFLVILVDVALSLMFIWFLMGFIPRHVEVESDEQQLSMRDNVERMT